MTAGGSVDGVDALGVFHVDNILVKLAWGIHWEPREGDVFPKRGYNVVGAGSMVQPTRLPLSRARSLTRHDMDRVGFLDGPALHKKWMECAWRWLGFQGPRLVGEGSVVGWAGRCVDVADIWPGFRLNPESLLAAALAGTKCERME